MVGVGPYADHTRHLAQHNRVRSAGASELETSLDQGGTYGAARADGDAQTHGPSD